MQVSLLFLLYIVNAIAVALILLSAFWADRSTSKNHKLSWAVIVVASALWFIALPLSLVEVLHKSLRRRFVYSQGKPSKHLS